MLPLPWVGGGSVGRSVGCVARIQKRTKRGHERGRPEKEQTSESARKCRDDMQNSRWVEQGSLFSLFKKYGFVMMSWNTNRSIELVLFLTNV